MENAVFLFRTESPQMILENVGLITPEKGRGEETLINTLPTTTTPSQILLDINNVVSIQSPQPSTSGFKQTHSLMLMNNTLHKRINLYSSEEEEHELEPKDKITLANLKSKKTKSPFQELMPAPNFAVIKNKPVRKAVIKGQRITKDLYNNREKTKENEKSKIQKRKGMKPKIENLKKTLRAASDKGKVKKTKVSPDTDWYCHACKVGCLSDMRQCAQCMKWYHEECIGLTNKDK
ncbi:hypothetical protein FQR65_LT05313 [Abscondita terminalis]|nr:hypothetical protein FQR65_LT05313 [Abscondita terminalis]